MSELASEPMSTGRELDVVTADHVDLPAPAGRATDPAFDIADIPFSYRGSWLNLSPVVGLHRRSEHVHLVSHRTNLTAVLALCPARDGLPVEADCHPRPASLTWQAGDGTIDVVFASTVALRLRGHGLGLVLRAADPALTPFTGTYLFQDPKDGSWTFTSYETGRRYRVTTLAGRVEAAGAEALGRAARQLAISGESAVDGWEIVLEELDTARAPFVAGETFTEAVDRVTAEFAEFAEAVAPWRSAATPAAALAAYVLWSASVEPAGFVGREAVLMSKHWMDSVWSWDHCFNALALSALPDLALDQFLLPFDHQDESGALPDSVTHSRVLHNYVKPPIHGWAFDRLRQRLPVALDRDDLAAVYARLAAWSSFWLEHRVGAGRSLPAYHHGNDSGWDNSTVFDADRVVETADLAAFLARQLDTVAGLADELGRPEEAQKWRARAGQLVDDVVAQLWDGDAFVATAPLSGRRSRSRSLLTTLPIVAADRLPADVVAALAERIRGLLTAHGPATEPVDSPHYEPDGYWRGPIWAPSTVLVEDGLRRAGYADLADEISARFRRLCERSGFAENFDALSGQGLRDLAYTWTAAAYLLLAGEHEARRSPDAAPAR